MQERRFTRFSTQLKGHYFWREQKRGWEECTVNEVSRKGLGITFHTGHTMTTGATAHIEIYVPGELEPVMVKGKLKWIKQKGNNFIGGIELTKILDEITFGKLS